MRAVCVSVLITLAVGCRSSTKGEEPAKRAPAEAVPVVHHDPVDRATRDRFRHPARVIAALELSPGQQIADIGAGYGYLTFRLAEAVGPSGRVVATDVDEGALDALRGHKPFPANVIVRRVSADDPGLERGMYDLILLSEVDHYLPDRVAFLRKLRPALTPTGRIAVTNRQALRPPLVDAVARAGYSIVGEVTDLPVHFLLLLRPMAK